MKAPKNRRVFAIGYSAATPLGKDFQSTWQNAVQGKAGFRKVSKCQVDSLSNIVGEIPDWDPQVLDFADPREINNWNAEYILLTMAVCQDALKRSGLELDAQTGPKTACLIGSALNGTDAFRTGMENLLNHGPLRVSPYLLPNLCANLPSSKAGILLGFTGPIFSPQGACASGNHCIGIGARMIRDGDCDFVLAGGVDTCIMPEIIHGFANMNATLKVTEKDRAYNDPTQASRPFSLDRKGMILSEGCGVVVLAAEEMLRTYGLPPKAEILGVGWTSDAFHCTKPREETITRAINMAIEDAELLPGDIEYINAHSTSTQRGDQTEVECLRQVFADKLAKIPISSNKSQLGHTLGASAGIEAALCIEGMQNSLVLPTVNHIQDPKLSDIDIVPNQSRRYEHELSISNSFGFGGTNCCVVFRGT